MKTTTLPDVWPLHDILLDSEKDQWLNLHQTREKAKPRTHAHDTVEWLVQNFELSKDFEVRRTAVFMHHHPRKVTRMTSIIEYSCTNTINVTNCSKQVHPQHNHGRTDHGLKQINKWQGHWQYFGWRHSRDLWDPPEYHNWR